MAAAFERVPVETPTSKASAWASMKSLTLLLGRVWRVNVVRSARSEWTSVAADDCYNSCWRPWFIFLVWAVGVDAVGLGMAELRAVGGADGALFAHCALCSLWWCSCGEFILFSKAEKWSNFRWSSSTVVLRRAGSGVKRHCSAAMMTQSPRLSGEVRTSQYLKEESAQQESDLAVFYKQAGDLTTEELREDIRRDRSKRLEALKAKYEQYLLELFFLQNGGNMMDLNSWKRKPNRQRDEFMNQNRLVDEDLSATQGSVSQPTNGNVSQAWTGHTGTPASLPASTRASDTGNDMSRKGPVMPPPPTHPGFQQTSVSSEDAQRARHEAQTGARIAELTREGLWSSRRLPLVWEPSREMTHWDYMLIEMEWLAVDFAQERRWKQAAAKKVRDNNH